MTTTGLEKGDGGEQRPSASPAHKYVVRSSVGALLSALRPERSAANFESGRRGCHFKYPVYGRELTPGVVYTDKGHVALMGHGNFVDYAAREGHRIRHVGR